MKRAEVAELFRRLRQLEPAPTTELVYRTPFELLIAVILSAQATDAGVNKATQRLFAAADTPQAILALGEDGLKRYISTIGLFNTKARNILATCALLVERHGGEVPRSREELQSLPGVGRKTANVILNTVFGEPTIAVDTHIFRVCNRTGLARGKTVRVVEDKLLKVVPDEYKPGAHHWLILHGRYVCIARKPKCPVCPIRDVCAYKHKTRPVWVARARVRAKARHGASEHHINVQQQSSSVVNRRGATLALHWTPADAGKQKEKQHENSGSTKQQYDDEATYPGDGRDPGGRSTGPGDDGKCPDVTGSVRDDVADPAAAKAAEPEAAVPEDGHQP